MEVNICSRNPNSFAARLSKKVGFIHVKIPHSGVKTAYATSVFCKKMEFMSPCSTAPQGHVHGVTSHSAPMSAQNRAACGAVSAAKRKIKYT